MSGNLYDNLPSNRTFGWFITSVFIFAGGYAFWKDAIMLVQPFFGFALIFLLLTVFVPRWLLPLNKLWYRFGELLGRVVSPIVLGSMFYLLITPVGLLMRLFGRDPLRMKKRSVSSFWLDRDPSHTGPDSFTNQF